MSYHRDEHPADILPIDLTDDDSVTQHVLCHRVKEEKFWMVAVHTDQSSYEEDRGAESPPRIKFYNRKTALTLARILSKRFKKTESRRV